MHIPGIILAIGLHRLGHGSSYVAIGPNFNVGRSTVLEAVEDVDALLELKDLYIKFPETEEQVIAARESFQLCSALPNVVCAIDGTHVKIKTPVENGPDYFSRYQDHDIVVQGVVDGNMIFYNKTWKLVTRVACMMHKCCEIGTFSLGQKIVRSLQGHLFLLVGMTYDPI